jgi:hypothetical protein
MAVETGFGNEHTNWTHSAHKLAGSPRAGQRSCLPRDEHHLSRSA